MKYGQRCSPAQLPRAPDCRELHMCLTLLIKPKRDTAHYFRNHIFITNLWSLWRKAQGGSRQQSALTFLQTRYNNKKPSFVVYVGRYRSIMLLFSLLNLFLYRVYYYSLWTFSVLIPLISSTIYLKMFAFVFHCKHFGELSIFPGSFTAVQCSAVQCSSHFQPWVNAWIGWNLLLCLLQHYL